MLFRLSSTTQKERNKREASSLANNTEKKPELSEHKASCKSKCESEESSRRKSVDKNKIYVKKIFRNNLLIGKYRFEHTDAHVWYDEVENVYRFEIAQVPPRHPSRQASRKAEFKEKKKKKNRHVSRIYQLSHIVRCRRRRKTF